MRCINKSTGTKIKRIALTLVVSAICIGCGKAEPALMYEADSSVSAFRFEKDVLATTDENKATGFAQNLCLRDQDTLQSDAVDLSESLSGILCDINGNRIIYAKDENLQLAPASLTKVMTALVALKNGSLDQVLTASENVVINESGATMCGLQPGDTMTLDQALHALLMQSANDAAVMIAENIGGSVEGFSDMMNQEALRIGATNSHFVNPHGLTAEEHYVTAYDMYLIFKEAIKEDIFTQIIHLDTYDTVYHNALGENVTYSAKTTNLYLKGDYESPEGITVIGGKTGTTNAARNCLVLMTRDSSGNPYVSVILNCSERQYLYQEMTQLLKTIP